MSYYRHEDAGVPQHQPQLDSNPNFITSNLPSSSSNPSPRLLGPYLARYDQPPLASASTGYAPSISHAHTSHSGYSQMGSETGNNNANARAGGAAGGDADDAGSVYSYNSARDVSNFVKELHGRCGVKRYSARLLLITFFD